ncbi:SNF2 family N-terminal domain-domain-containing protein [Microdochium bolleyi]|uniref:SNF2 family N-terminal domain-domain-containing protein n=1 Tax=Microdochium bolleyi TaxID=196109 RepID=A0A136J5U8_9PEZI|nr:SNF2 family N-terminal domain-domain-containing protein [Microdochium bolleyi]
MALNQILNHDQDFEFDFDGFGLAPSLAGQLPLSPYPLVQLQAPAVGSTPTYPTDLDFDDFLLQSQDSLGGVTSDDFLQFSSEARHQLEIGVEDWADVMQALPENISDHDASSRPDSSLSRNGDGGDDADQNMVCYGMLYEYDVKLISLDMHDVVAKLKASIEGQQAAPDAHLQKFTMSKRTESAILSLQDGTSFGYLREGQGKVLISVMEQWPALRFEGVAHTHLLLDRISKISKSPDRLHLGEIVGQELSSNKAYLQQPDHYLKTYPYRNPHVISFAGLDAASRRRNDVRDLENGGPPKNNKEERLQKIMAEVHETLNRTEEPMRTEGDTRLLTRLLPHQERALTFMIRRESGDVPDDDRLWRKTAIEGQEKYIHKISKTIATERPTEKGGGVLADEMGMGKTLTTISLIAKTLSQASEYVTEMQNSEHHTGKAHIYSHSTLIVVPSALLINTWTQQINRHVGDSISYLKYHGPSRLKDADALSKVDIVLTTYHTLASEFKDKRSLLHGIHWFRVVLDEAHMIRRPATTFHKTCCELEARSRWCLTGTPIQNRLQDIGALFVFIRAEPFHSMGQFRNSITLPFERGDEVVKDRLVMLYKSLCISRPRSKAELPEPIEHVHELEFTPEERDLYLRTERIMNRTIREVVGHVENQKTFGLFQTYLQLRISCNHGTWQKLFSWRRNRLRETKEAIEANRLDSEIRCGGCEQQRPSLEDHRHYPECGHFLCSDCRDDYNETGDLDHADRICPLCRIEVQPHPHHQSVVAGPRVVPLFQIEEETQRRSENASHNDSRAENYFNDTGHSTKMMALMQDVKQDLYTTKSIIFSCWTSTLDLIGTHLDREEIRFLRIDGETPTKKRQRLLDQFDNEEVQVLIMTTGTGAFGLNIVSAQRVFIVESQWNPSVENQAISRAIRIGQKEHVIVTRYIIKGTVEEEMRSQQKRKKDAARLGW